MGSRWWNRRAGLGVAALATLLVVIVAPAFACVPGGEFTVTPSQGPPGSTVVVSGRHLDPGGTPVNINWGNAEGGTLATAQPTPENTFSVEVRIPSSAPFGAAGLEIARGMPIFTLPFTVTGGTPAKATPTTAPPTSPIDPVAGGSEPAASPAPVTSPAPAATSGAANSAATSGTAAPTRATTAATVVPTTQATTVSTPVGAGGAAVEAPAAVATTAPAVTVAPLVLGGSRTESNGSGAPTWLLAVLGITGLGLLCVGGTVAAHRSRRPVGDERVKELYGSRRGV